MGGLDVGGGAESERQLSSRHYYGVDIRIRKSADYWSLAWRRTNATGALD